MMRRQPFIACWVIVAFVLSGCRRHAAELVVHEERSPTAAASLVPQMTAWADGRALVSWQRPLAGGGYAFEMAVQNGAQWSEVRTIAEGPKLSMFTADLPGVATLAGAKLLAYWEVRDDRGNRYATVIRTAISTDEGRSWIAASTPYGDELAGQHSFLSWIGRKDGIGLLWLDAQARSQVRHALMEKGMEEGHTDLGSVGLRYASLDAEGQLKSEQFVDPITCECCPTSAATTDRGAVVVYRGRQEAPGTLPSEVHDDRPTVRDIYIVRQQDGAWGRPHLVHKDNWVINGCPDNGPAVDALANHIAVAWWTRSNEQAKVQVAFSADAGESFGSAFRVDAKNGEGQVTLSLLRDGHSAIVGWLENGETWARSVSDTGAMSQPAALGLSPHHSRLPHWIRNGDGSVTAVWTSKRDGVTHLQISRIDSHPAD